MTMTTNTTFAATKGNTMIVFTHDLPASTDKKLAKKLRRQARDEMRALFDYDAIRVYAPAPVAVADAFDMYDETEDADAVFEAFVNDEEVNAA